MKKICVLFSIMTIATASLNTETDNLLSTALKFVRDCGDKSMLLCAKVSIVIFLLLLLLLADCSEMYSVVVSRTA